MLVVVVFSPVVVGLEDGAAVAAAPGDFCLSCHSYAAVKIDCFECHSGKPAAKVAKLP